MPLQADLICQHCGHQRSQHADNGPCTVTVNLAAPTPSQVACPCVSFRLAPEEVPAFVEAEAEAEREYGEHSAAADAVRLVRAIDNGNMDPYLEVILAAAHDRKRTLRNVRGFPRYDDRRRE